MVSIYARKAWATPALAQPRHVVNKLLPLVLPWRLIHGSPPTQQYTITTYRRDVYSAPTTCVSPIRLTTEVNNRGHAFRTINI